MDARTTRLYKGESGLDFGQGILKVKGKCMFCVKTTRIMYKWANEWMNDGYYCMDEKEKFVINGRLHRMAANYLPR